MSFLRLFRPLVEKIPGAATYYRYVRDSKSLGLEVEFRDKLGFFFNGNLSMEKGEFEPQETRIIESLFGSFDLFVNIGANTGYYVCKALNLGVPVVAFEPNQLNVNILLRNIEANGFETDFQLFPIALSNQNGVLPMYGASTGASLIDGWAGQKNKYLVAVSKFDSTAKFLVDGKSCLVLIDIEGAELDCLKGAETLLAAPHTVFLVEICTGAHQPQEINVNPNLVETFDLMFSHGYEAFTADTNLRRIEINEINEIARSGIDTLGINNFIFTRDKDLLGKINFVQ